MTEQHLACCESQSWRLAVCCGVGQWMADCLRARWWLSWGPSIRRGSWNIRSQLWSCSLASLHSCMLSRLKRGTSRMHSWVPLKKSWAKWFWNTASALPCTLSHFLHCRYHVLYLICSDSVAKAPGNHIRVPYFLTKGALQLYPKFPLSPSPSLHVFLFHTSSHTSSFSCSPPALLRRRIGYSWPAVRWVCGTF